jgi:hypothetical protein
MDNPKTPAEDKPTEQLHIMEWRYNQFLGEKLSIDQIKKDKENESFLVTNLRCSDDGNVYAVSDKGGRIIIFKRGDGKTSKFPKLNYHYEYASHEKEFDVHKSTEYDEAVRGLCILNNTSNKIDILSCGYRTIKLDRVINNGRLNTFDTDQNPHLKSSNHVPKLLDVKYDTKHKTKREYRLAHTFEINSLSENRFNKNNFISSDDFKLLFWDINYNKEVYNIVDIENTQMEVDNPEKITVSKFSKFNPSLMAFGTNKGMIRLCDLRTSSDVLSTSKKYFDENSTFNKTIFSNVLSSVHDVSFHNPNNEHSIVSRHYLSLNIWDQRNLSAPLNKFLLYEPLINKLSFLYQNNFMNDKFSLSTDNSGKYILTGGYNNMFHVIDIDQKLNTQIVIDDSNEKIMNTNVIRKINSKGSCYYKKDDPAYDNINFDKKILHQCYSPVENLSLLIVLNCIYTYSGNITKKDNEPKKKK